MKDIIVEFSGWVRLSPDKARFQSLHPSENGKIISGTDWLNLPSDEDRCDYILEDVVAAQRDCDDGNYEHIDVFEDDTP